MKLVTCPICNSEPDVDQCDFGGGWYAHCYKSGFPEHFIGGNGATRVQAIQSWEDEVKAWKLKNLLSVVSSR